MDQGSVAPSTSASWPAPPPFVPGGSDCEAAAAFPGTVGCFFSDMYCLFLFFCALFQAGQWHFVLDWCVCVFPLAQFDRSDIPMDSCLALASWQAVCKVPFPPAFLLFFFFSFLFFHPPRMRSFILVMRSELCLYIGSCAEGSTTRVWRSHGTGCFVTSGGDRKVSFLFSLPKRLASRLPGLSFRPATPAQSRAFSLV